MKKQFLNLGKALNKAEQQKINGGEMDYRCTDQCGSSMGHDWGCSSSNCLTRYCGGYPNWHYCAEL
ncbi:MAG: hypothetical protein IBX66_07240 [Lutibacter sp.]|nr:hypothetical protein [Lutibacter sp.]